MSEKTEKRILSYSREQMMIFREYPRSRTRPPNLSVDFNNDDGLFSPDKWLQYRWQCEGVENRPIVGSGATAGGALKKKSNSRTEEVVGHELETVLSPQRRGFSSGCRAPSPKTVTGVPPMMQLFKEDSKTMTKSRWRHGHLINGVDFKPSFQKNALESNRNRTGNSVWRNSADRPSNDKSGRHQLSQRDKPERIPEWVDEGPSSMTDIIELKGFDDDVREKRSKRRKQKESKSSERVGGVAERSTTASEERAPSKVSSETNEEVALVTHHAWGESDDEDLSSAAALTANVCEAKFEAENLDEAKAPSAPTMLMGEMLSMPNSDAEFAAYMGLLDIDPTTIKKESATYQANQPSSSRLSRFFCKNSEQFEQQIFPPESSNHQQTSQLNSFADHRAIIGGANGPSPLDFARNGGGGIGNLPPALKELFSAMPPKGPTSSSNFNEGMTVQELERDMTAKLYQQHNSALGGDPPMPPPFSPHHLLHQQHRVPSPNHPHQPKLVTPPPPGDPSLAEFHQHLQMYMQRMAAAKQQAGGGGFDGMPMPKFPPPMYFPPHNSDGNNSASTMLQHHHQQMLQQQRQQQQQDYYQQQHSGSDAVGGGNGSGVCRSPFMPTSVIRQLSKAPGGGNSMNVFSPESSNHQQTSHLNSFADHRAIIGGANGPSPLNFARNGGGGIGNLPPALKELFSAMPPKGPTSSNNFNEGMTVQELERDMTAKLYQQHNSALGGDPPMPPPFSPHHLLHQQHRVPSPNHPHQPKLVTPPPPGDPSLAEFHQHLQMYMQRMAAAKQQAGGGGFDGMPMQKFPPPMYFPPHNSDGNNSASTMLQHHHQQMLQQQRQQQQQDYYQQQHSGSDAVGGGNSSGVCRSPFMPTSVIRQLSKAPGGGSPINTASFAADQQQLNLAITRGDLAAAQAIRARMIAQVQALANFTPAFQDS